jgi:hypothetical protein
MGIIGAGLRQYLEGQQKDLTKPAGICLTFLQANLWLLGKHGSIYLLPWTIHSKADMYSLS